MNNIYVDELPDDDCPCNHDGRCTLLDRTQCNISYYGMEKYEHCPLKLVSDRLAEERKKVVQEIRELYEDSKHNPTTIFGVIRRCDLNRILDQIERGE